jgi:hypothetical protein
MLKVDLTENYAGVTIYGDYDDLNYLYDSIHFLIHGEPDNIGKYTMQNHLYGFLYDIRHAYQGQRGIELIDNNLNDNSRKWFDLKKNDVTDKNVCFNFNYVLPDLLLSLVLIKHFVEDIDKKEENIFNPYINYINFFYSLVLGSIFKILTPIRFNKIKKSLFNSFVSDNIFYPQWFEIISSDYVNFTKKKRQKEFMKMADSIINYYEYKDYIEMKQAMKKICEEKNCTLDDFHYYNYPKEINW